jgi:glycosyltransferase involved in cell wall biosynthesis
MKVIVQIPCYNEEETLPLVLKTIPKKIKGVDTVEILVIDDGSTDKTVEVAEKLGVHHIVTRPRNVGLARQFHEGVDYALEHGADILVNTDGDNQYPQEKIGDLVQPILKGGADIVIADRQTATIAHFSPLKKLLQKFGSFIVNKAAGTDIPDSVSGFRAYSKKSLLRLNIVTRFSYCTETIIQAGYKRLAITSIPIETNPKTRESRLFKNIWHHIYKSGVTIIRAYIMYKPHLVFGTLTAIFLIAGLIPFVRFLILTVQGSAGGHLQSLVVGVVLLMAALLAASLGIIADLIRTNRALHEDTLERIKESRYGN